MSMNRESDTAIYTGSRLRGPNEDQPTGRSLEELRRQYQREFEASIARNSRTASLIAQSLPRRNQDLTARVAAATGVEIERETLRWTLTPDDIAADDDDDDDPTAENSRRYVTQFMEGRRQVTYDPRWEYETDVIRSRPVPRETPMPEIRRSARLNPERPRRSPRFLPPSSK